MAITQQFWKQKNILLTGHTGFKGSWMSLWLQKLGSDLVGFSKSIPTEPSLFKIANVEDGMTSIMGDICDHQKLLSVINEFKPEIIIHMAAQALVLKSYDDPLETFSTNVMGTANLFESVRLSEQNVRVIINVTSDKCYENFGVMKEHKETDPMGGYDPYSSSKGCAELITSSYRNSFFNSKNTANNYTAIASVRAGNVIGGGDWSKNRLLPDIINSKLKNTVIKIRHPDSIRPWQHVLDPLRGYLLLSQNLWKNGPKYSESWNFGPSSKEGKSVLWITKKLTEFWNSGKWELDSKSSEFESRTLLLDSTKAKNKLNWIPKMNLELALKWTVDWYKKFQKTHNMREFTESQITQFSML